MLETFFLRNMIEIIEGELSQNDNPSLKRVQISIGELYPIDSESFMQIFKATAEGEVLANAGLTIKRPPLIELGNIKAPVLGLYGGNDNRVNSTIPDAEREMKRLGKRYEVNIYEGAGHAFLRNQSGQSGANMNATKKAWPHMVEFFRENLGS